MYAFNIAMSIVAALFACIILPSLAGPSDILFPWTMQPKPTTTAKAQTTVPVRPVLRPAPSMVQKRLLSQQAMRRPKNHGLTIKVEPYPTADFTRTTTMTSTTQGPVLALLSSVLDRQMCSSGLMTPVW